MSSIKLRNEYKGAIDSNKAEYFKMNKEVDKLDLMIKKERLIDKTTDSDLGSEESDKYNYLSGKVNKQNNNLNKANQMGNEIVTTQGKTMEELIRQREKLKSANNTISEVEQTLSLHDQFVACMNNRELFAKLKLVFVIVLLGIANLIVLNIKLFK